MRAKNCPVCGMWCSDRKPCCGGNDQYIEAMIRATDADSRNTAEQLVRLSIRVADCLHTAMLCGRGLGSEFRREALTAESQLREFINESNDQVDNRL